MNVHDAVTLINTGMCPFPGWHMEATESVRVGGAIVLTLTIADARDHGRQHAPDYSVRMPDPGQVASFHVIVDDITDRRELLGRVVDTYVEAFTHEVREAVRFLDDMEAPFHPHIPSTIAAWSDRTGRDRHRDLTFGVAS